MGELPVTGGGPNKWGPSKWEGSSAWAIPAHWRSQINGGGPGHGGVPINGDSGSPTHLWQPIHVPGACQGDSGALVTPPIHVSPKTVSSQSVCASPKSTCPQIRACVPKSLRVSPNPCASPDLFPPPIPAPPVLHEPIQQHPELVSQRIWDFGGAGGAHRAPPRPTGPT